MDMRNLKIQIKIKTDILSLDTVYGVHLVFKFCDPIKVYSNPIYVNLKYKRGMMIELCRFLNQKEVTVCEVSLESFSGYYCGSGAIYIKGVEFQAIENARLKIYTGSFVCIPEKCWLHGHLSSCSTLINTILKFVYR